MSDISGRYTVQNSDTYREVLGVQGDTPEEITLERESEDLYTLNERWINRGEGVVRTVSATTAETLVHASNALSDT